VNIRLRRWRLRRLGCGGLCAGGLGLCLGLSLRRLAGDASRLNGTGCGAVRQRAASKAADSGGERARKRSEGANAVTHSHCWDELVWHRLRL